MGFIELEFWERHEEQVTMTEQEEKDFGLGLLSVQWKKLALN